MPSMNGAKFCWSFQQTRLPVVRSRCRNALPGQEIGALGLIVALRALAGGAVGVDRARPIQLWVGGPRSDGWIVPLVLVPTAVPLTYIVPTVPLTVIAMCDHWF